MRPKLKTIGQAEIATCPSCQHVWSTRKEGGPKKCPRCQQKFEEAK